VVTFSDVTRLKEVESGLLYEKTYAENIVETVRDPLLVLDRRTGRSCPPIPHSTARFAPLQRTPWGASCSIWGTGSGTSPRFDRCWQKSTAEARFCVRTSWWITISPKSASARCSSTPGGSNRPVECPPRVLVSLEDVTVRKASRGAIAGAGDSLARSNEDLEIFAYVASHDLQEPPARGHPVSSACSRAPGRGTDQKSQE